MEAHRSGSRPNPCPTFSVPSVPPDFGTPDNPYADDFLSMPVPTFDPSAFQELNLDVGFTPEPIDYGGWF